MSFLYIVLKTNDDDIRAKLSLNILCNIKHAANAATTCVSRAIIL